MLTKWTEGRTETSYGGVGLLLLDGRSNQVLSLQKVGDNIKFTEECDGFFHVTVSKEDAIQALLEAIAWVKEESS